MKSRERPRGGAATRPDRPGRTSSLVWLSPGRSPGSRLTFACQAATEGTRGEPEIVPGVLDGRSAGGGQAGSRIRRGHPQHPHVQARRRPGSREPHRDRAHGRGRGRGGERRPPHRRPSGRGSLAPRGGDGLRRCRRPIVLGHRRGSREDAATGPGDARPAGEEGALVLAAARLPGHGPPGGRSPRPRSRPCRHAGARPGRQTRSRPGPRAGQRPGHRAAEGRPHRRRRVRGDRIDDGHGGTALRAPRPGPTSVGADGRGIDRGRRPGVAVPRPRCRFPGARRGRPLDARRAHRHSAAGRRGAPATGVRPRLPRAVHADDASAALRHVPAPGRPGDLRGACR